MIVKCPNCNGALEYDVITDKMVCVHCRSSFFVGEFQTSEQKKEANVMPKQQEMPQQMVQGMPQQMMQEMSQPLQRMAYQQPQQQETYMADEPNDEDMMECNMYSCKACGAELMINNVESSTYCAYCGQPTIVFERVSVQKRPKYIIPFAITKEQAVNLIRKRMNEGAFVPSEIKNFEVDVIRGIYIPFYLVDLHYQDEMLIKGKVKSGKNTTTKYYYRKAETDFYHIPVDASRKLNDNSSQRLEPYIVSEAKPFNPQYLSGYYADCSDEKSADLDYKSSVRAKAMFEQEVLKTVSASDKAIMKNRPHCFVKNKDYAMFPAWFLVFNYMQKHYTIMVNGQTGKVVGAVPYKKRELWSFLIAMSALLSVIMVPVLYGIFSAMSHDGEGMGDLLSFIVFGCVALIGVTSAMIKSYKHSRALSEETMIKQFVKDRQEGM